jgi:hypothetical protein
MSMISVTDGWVVPSLLFLADWSVRWGLLLAMLLIVLASRPPRQAARRYLLCACAMGAGILLPTAPRWGTTAIHWPSPKIVRPIEVAAAPSDRHFENAWASASDSTTFSAAVGRAHLEGPRHENAGPSERPPAMPTPSLGF